MGHTITWQAAQVRERWPVPGERDNKYSRAVVGVIAGSVDYQGAAVLAASGAVRAGAGMVRYVGPPPLPTLVLHHRPEVVVHHPRDAVRNLPRAQAWVVGPGVANHPEQDAAIDAVIAPGLPMVVDAGALEMVVLSRASGVRPQDSDRVLLTPHAEELARSLRLLGHEVTGEEVSEDRVGYAQLLAEAAHATVLLKGARTVIATPGGDTIELPTAPAWLATAGSGDVLAGIAGTLLAQGLPAADAGACAAWIHGSAARLASGGGPIAALDIAGALGPAIADLLSPRVNA